jgi:putative hydrolase of the HAD superfamily
VTETRALVLDFGGVISKTLFETHGLTERALGLAAGSLTWRGPFAPETDSLWTAMQEGEISERDYWLARAREVGAMLGETWTTMAEFVVRARGGDPISIIRPEALSTIAAAKAVDAKLAVLSNELDLFYGADFRDDLPFLSSFDVICDATYTEVLKPDPRAYLDCCERLSLPPEACVFVDDQPRNIAGAHTVGMQTVTFDVRTPGASFAHAVTLLQTPAVRTRHA